MKIVNLRGEPYQEALWLNTTDPEVYFIGGYRSGKTWAGVRWLITRAFMNPPSVVGLACEPTYDLLRDVLVVSLEEACEQLGIAFAYNQMAKRVTLGTGRESRNIMLRSTEEPERIVGFTAGYALDDEGALHSHDGYIKISARISDPKATLMQLLVTTTPEGTRTWVADKERKGARVVRAATWQNKALSPEYIRKMKEDVFGGDPAGMRQYMEGIATDSSGNIYSQLGLNNIQPFVHRSPVRVCVGWDFNTHNMVTPIFAWDSRSQTLHCIGEVVSKSVSGVTTEEHARKVSQAVLETGLAVQHMGRLVNKSDTEPVWAFIDASGSQRRSSATWTDEAAVRAAGFQPRHDASNPLVRDRIQGVRLALSGGRLLFDEARCPNTLRAMREHAYDKNGDPQKKWGPKDFEADHWTDAVGYACYGLMPVKMR